ncbi:MAG: nickel pincer cofactor biosynthesis protein LarC, partial [Myxococcales bacterium]
MTIAALLDLGVPLLVVERAVASLPIEGFHLHRDHTHRSGIVAAHFDVHVEGSQPERTYRSIDDMLAASSLDDRVKGLARRIFRRLAEAESTVHRMPLDEVHFHEVGAVDAIVDIVGAAACLIHLGASEIVASPLPMGHGLIRARHGILPLPAPATVLCLQGVPTYAVDLPFELVTPTGAAIVATVAARFERWPAFAPERVGWGAGTRDLPDRPNLLRAVLGSGPGATTGSSLAGSHVVLEANIDDMTGELAGHTIEALLAAGALDAWAAPVTMKKGRPGLLLSALTEASTADAITTVMLRETTTLGVRRLGATRTERPRRFVQVETPYGTIPVKVSEGPYGPPTVKPEFDACARAAAAHGVPVRAVIAAALAKVR